MLFISKRIFDYSTYKPTDLNLNISLFSSSSNIKMINDSWSLIIFTIFQLLNRLNRKKAQNQSILHCTIALINTHRTRIRLLYSKHSESIESNGIQSSPIVPGWIPKAWPMMMMMMMTAVMILLFFSPFSFDGRINSLFHYAGIRFFSIISFCFFVPFVVEYLNKSGAYPTDEDVNC